MRTVYAKKGNHLWKGIICEEHFMIPLNWRAPYKGGICTDFIAIFQVAQNLLKFAMPTLLYVKKFVIIVHSI